MLSHNVNLSGLDDTQGTEDPPGSTDSSGIGDETVQPIHQEEQMEAIRLPKATRVSARHLQEVSFTRKYLAKRERRLACGKRISRSRAGHFNNATVTDAEAARHHLQRISTPKNSLLNARTVQEVGRISAIRREASGPISKVQRSNGLLRLRHTQEMQKKRAKAKAAKATKQAINAHSASSHRHVNENTGHCRTCRRHHPPTQCTRRTGRASTTNRLAYAPDCPRTRPSTVTVLAYGTAGSGAGSRIHGHVRWGGKWLREQLLRQDVVVVVTDEFCTSKTCTSCFQRLQLQKSRRLVGGQIKTRAVNGAVVCPNPLCPAVRAGYATRPRDSNAALGILLAMASVALPDRKDPPWPLLPYARYVRPRELPSPSPPSPPPAINTGEHEPDHPSNRPEQMGQVPSAIMAAAGRAPRATQGQTTRYVQCSGQN